MAKHATSIDAQIAGSIRKLARGLYDTPRIDAALGALAPSTDDIANALRARDGARLQAAGAHTANLLGLSNHVPSLSALCSSPTVARGRYVWVAARLCSSTPRRSKWPRPGASAAP